ncbi:MAG TPA: class I SAM-dependent methyltransferase [Phycisphaerae bacterium]|nr:class I SAM-dependent methyltransferase [Phycisphaerae bacterium]HRW53958.1 class I SAM-dependent methyltransferase [Phycisphaerae bacterium]
MDDAYLALLVDLHVHQARQGPGGADETRTAIALANLQTSKRLRIADLGCGTGASTLVLAEALDADITAVDLAPEFIDVLSRTAGTRGLDQKIHPLVGSMERPPFAESTFDVIWSEGAIYNMGFRNGVQTWRHYLKPGGVLVVSEITWTTDTRPAELHDYWLSAYPEIATASSKIEALEQSGYAPLGYFALPAHCWLDNYYQPLRAQIPEFLARHRHAEMAVEIAEAEEKEFAFYQKHSRHYSYGVYIAERIRGD